MTPFGMSRGCTAALAVSVCAAVVLSAGAEASIHGWRYEPGTAGTIADSNGGAVSAIDARYDSTTRRLDWSVEFSDRVTEGLALVVSDGALPRSRRGQYAMIYFDAAGALAGGQSPKLTAYAYNGRGVPDSWFDGDGDPSNNGVLEPRPDCIKTVFDSGWVLGASAADVLLDGGIQGRRFTLSIDASDLIAHTPDFPGNGDTWRGTGFTQSLGLWMFTSQIFDVVYRADGEIESLGTEVRGSLEGNSLLTYDIPAPGAAALLGLGSLMLVRRRR